jgi:hypothetical protein
MRAIEAALDDLAVTVTDVSGAAAALPRRIALPAVPSQRSISVASGGRPPRTHATSGASGGG